MSPENKQRASAAFAELSHTSVATAHLVRRWYRFWLAPFCDGYSGLSLNRFLAVLFAVDGSSGVFQHPRVPLTWPDIAAMVIAGSLAFGQKAWTAYLQRSKEDLK